MNRKQIVALWAGVALILLACIFPPTTINHVYPSSTTEPAPIQEHVELRYIRSAEFGSVIDGERLVAASMPDDLAPEDVAQYPVWYVEGVRVDYLAMIWVAIGAVTLGAVLSLKR